MLMPNKTKFRKQHKGRIHGVAKGGSELAFGSFGLKAMTPERVTARQIEAVRVAISRKMKKGGKIWIRIFPDRPVTEKPLETRMGKGKGNVEYWTAAVKRGRVMFEIAGVPRELAEQAFRTASFKLPIKVKMLTREGAGE